MNTWTKQTMLKLNRNLTTVKTNLKNSLKTQKKLSRAKKTNNSAMDTRTTLSPISRSLMRSTWTMTMV